MNIYVHSVTMQRSRNETGRVLWQYAQCQGIQCHFNQDKQLSFIHTNSRLHTVRITGILNTCYHITTMDDNTF